MKRKNSIITVICALTFTCSMLIGALVYMAHAKPDGPKPSPTPTHEPDQGVSYAVMVIGGY